MILQKGTLQARFTALGLLIVLLLAGHYVVDRLILETYDQNRSEIADLRERLQRFNALADERAHLAELLADLESNADLMAGYLRGPSDALAAAELQERAAETIETAGGEVVSAQFMPASEVEDAPATRRALLKLHFSTSIEGLASALYELETAGPHLMVEQLAITSENRRQLRRNKKTAPRLDVKMELAGYIRQSDE